MLTRWRLWLGLAVTALFLGLFLFFIDLAGMARALRQANYWYMLPAVAVYFGGVAVRAVRWALVLGPVKPVSPARLFPVVVIGFTANNVLPARLGEFVRAYLLGQREGMSKTVALGTVAVDRLFDGLALLAFFFIAVLLIPGVHWAQDPVIINVVRITAGIFGGVALFFLALVIFPRHAQRWGARVLQVMTRAILWLPLGPGRRPVLMFEGRIEGLVTLFLQGLEMMRSPWRVSLALALSLAIWTAEAAMFLFIALGFGIHLPFTVMLLATATSNLITTVPSSQGGVGPFEGVLVGTLALFGVASGLAGAFAVALHAALLVPVTLLGFVLLWAEHIRWRDLFAPLAKPSAGNRVAPSNPGERRPEG
ncbi:MAG: flippase-like domain-containing protein [Chloroflexi bacterium]|nr:flippase-like domain-containing protein [Chloroflexota bacterium]